MKLSAPLVYFPHCNINLVFIKKNGIVAITTVVERIPDSIAASVFYVSELAINFFQIGKVESLLESFFKFDPKFL